MNQRVNAIAKINIKSNVRKVFFVKVCLRRKSMMSNSVITASHAACEKVKYNEEIIRAVTNPYMIAIFLFASADTKKKGTTSTKNPAYAFLQPNVPYTPKEISGC